MAVAASSPARTGEAMRRVHELAEKAAAGTINVLIIGETGVGKELLAETVHRASPRRGGPYVCLNCAALSETLLESELFGHERGAFTGAVQAKPGLLETAARGTLFLDEVGRAAAGDAGEAAARDRDARGRAPGQRAPAPHRRPLHRGHQPRPGGGGRARRVPARPLLPPQRHHAVDPAAARAHRRDSPAGRDVRAADLPRPGTAGADGAAVGAGEPRGVRLARQHPRAEERHRARRCCCARGRCWSWTTCRWNARSPRARR